MLCYCRFLFFYFFIFQVPGSGSRIRIQYTDPDPKHCPGLFPYRLTLGDEVTLPFDTSQFRQSMQLRAISKSAVFSIICFITYLWLVWFWVKIVKIRLIYRLLAGSMYLPLHLVTLILKKKLWHFVLFAQRFAKGTTPDIRSRRYKLASKASGIHLMSDSSAGLL